MPVLFHIYFIPVTLGDIIDILTVATVIYSLLMLMEGSRARAMLSGLAVLLLLAFFSLLLNLQTVAWAIRGLQTVWLIAFIIVFQPELREILSRIGNSRIFRAFAPKPSAHIIEDIVEATKILSEGQVGALIAIQRLMPLDDIVSTGRPINAKLTAELLATIFAPHTPLHDGGVIIVEDKIIAAACEFPMSENPRYRQILGMRHRAGVGLAEHSDAAVVVVSEETGAISLAVRGHLRREITPEALRRLLDVVISGKAQKKEKK